MYDYFLYFLGYILFAGTFFLGIMMFVSQKTRKKFTWLCILVQWAVILILSILLAWLKVTIGADSWVNYVDFSIIGILADVPVVFFYSEKPTKLWYDVFCSVAVRTATAKIITCVIYFIPMELGILSSIFTNIFVILIYVPFYFLFARKIAGDDYFHPSISETVFMIIFTVSTYPMAYFEPILQASGDLLYVYLVIIEVIIAYGVVFFLYYIHRNSEKNREIVAAEEEDRRRLAQYSEFQSVIDIMNRKCHDLKHQIRDLTASSAVSEDVTHELENIAKEYEAFVKTGNDKVDTILTEKKFACISKNIRMSCAVNGPAFDFLSLEDSNSLLGNLLDNAIEYLDTVPDTSLREIRIRSSEGGGWLKLTVENYFSGTLEYRKGGIPKSTKGDSYSHGFGTLSISKIAEKYGGHASFRTQEDAFIAQVLFPEPQAA